MTYLPRMKAGLLHHALDGQTLVYDPSVDQVHLLDPMTAYVLGLMQAGPTSVDRVSAQVADRFNLPAGNDAFELALEQLRDARLVDESDITPKRIEDTTRRRLVKKLAAAGVAAFLIPAIATVTATPGYAAGTLSPNGTACTSDGQCTSGICNQNLGNTCQPCQPSNPVNANCNRNIECCSGSCKLSNNKCN